MKDFDAIAAAFVTARRNASGLADYPGTKPASLTDAYDIQDRALALAGGEVVGWKVGKINAPLDGELGANRLAGPIFADSVRDGVDQAPAMPVFADGFAAAEAEFLLRIGRAPDPAKTSYTMEEAADLLDAVHVGIEIASSPFPGINSAGPLVTISDFGNNYGLVVGAAIENWRDLSFIDWPVTLDIDGERIGAATSRTMLDGPIGAARFLFEALAKRGIALRPGQFISSGAVTGVHEVVVGASVTATFNGIEVSCSIEAAGPAQGD
ncbi:2-keto-4-pentenoate hydratase [Sphingomonas turrisvirgatae]|uniref:2-keto-4-pentenoate hydratase n=1 Tax=Sphingomonas turrisvirgatae TaxID=1888892 RepID=A0A1E3LU07_9SPHN|nr:2-keto-4-pentenoate hydratase [Sphingomonas turrisvirgatae]ODP37252.1 2-keto-4-pentenoate hydratase [Sphingomonas turrisvirgatae]